jgi:cold shock CspA family protein
MRYQGKITTWKDEKGFGFVTMNATGEKAFVHIKSFSSRSKRPVVGDKITYELKMDENNRMRAENIRFVGELTASAKSSKSVLFGSAFLNKLLFAALVLLLGYVFFYGRHTFISNNAPASITEQRTDKSDAIIASAFSNRQSNLQISGQGVVTKILPDDDIGSRHQKFIIRLTTGQTLLIAHNIDIAPRISFLKQGDSVQFNGVYEWNEKGGVIHWTHRDPDGSHVAGWLEHQGQRYQ